MFSKSSHAFTPRPATTSPRQIGVWGILAFAMLFAIQASAAQISLAWNVSPSASVTGYKLYYGQASGNYTTSSDVGNNLSYTVGGLTSGQNYYFAVTAYDAAGAQSAFSNEVAGTAPTATTADFTASPTSGTAPLTATFVNKSAGATSYSWNFGDSGSTNNTSTAASPTHTYNSAGAYTVTLNATGADGTKSKTLTSYINVSAPAATANKAPTGTITSPSANATVAQGSSVSFQGTGTDPDNNTPLAYSWNFGNGSTPSTSTAQNPTVTFGTAGTYTVSLTVKDSKGLAATTPATRVVTVTAPAAASTTIWPATAVPANLDRGDSTPVNLGVRFTSSKNGYITGIRFYKSLANTGTHIGSLWTSNGTNLAKASFTNETASGWQQVNFAAPVPISANTVYVASYFAPNGHFSWDDNCFATAGVTNGPLTAPTSKSLSPNGAYAYGSGPAFPASGYYPRNYWVDVVFKPTN